jgi:hypothetical protein
VGKSVFAWLGSVMPAGISLISSPGAYKWGTDGMLRLVT